MATVLPNHTIRFKPSIIMAFIAGMLAPLGFAPVHLPGFAILSIAWLFVLIQQKNSKQSAILGFFYGLGYFGLGVSWVFVSIHNYGHLNIFISVVLTLLFVSYLSLFFVATTSSYVWFRPKHSKLLRALSFSAIWCLGEFARANFLGGFPWLTIGFSQMDTPIHYLFPILGIYAGSFAACLCATTLFFVFKSHGLKRILWITGFTALLLAPTLLQNHSFTILNKKPISVAAIQANLSMRDKWDQLLFWKLLDFYKLQIAKVIDNNQVVVLPESAIPVPENYVNDYLNEMNEQAVQANTSILLGIPRQTSNTTYYNSLLSLGNSYGSYNKIHLVPFGEYIPKPFKRITELLQIPITDITAGLQNQALVHIHNIPVASLICYELAYPNLLRTQLPEAQLIVSISDDGWFGRSFAIYQQLQMAQALSVLSERYQIVANNDGLSSIIDNKGTIVSTLPAFTSGVLTGKIYPATGTTPWRLYGDIPVLLFAFLLLCALIIKQLLTPFLKTSYKPITS